MEARENSWGPTVAPEEFTPQIVFLAIALFAGVSHPPIPQQSDGLDSPATSSSESCAAQLACGRPDNLGQRLSPRLFKVGRTLKAEAYRQLPQTRH
jgi:hypothetical protein